MSDGDAWWNLPWRAIDRMMREWSLKAQKIIRRLRLAQAILLVLAALPLAAAVLTFWFDFMVPVALTLMAVYLIIPLVGLWFLVGLPLKAKSIVRLIEKGYPRGAKEFAIRAAARKLHEQSIETEELLVDTAINESRKALKKYRARADRLKRDLEEIDDQPAVDDDE